VRVRFPIGTHRRRSSGGAHSLLGEGCVLDMRETTSVKTLFYLLKCSFGFNFCKLNTCHSNCNNYFIT
jgi:hypothetical protein